MPRSEPTRLLAAPWTSSKFTTGRTGERAAARFWRSAREDLVDFDDAALIALVRDELRRSWASAPNDGGACVPLARGNPQYESAFASACGRMEALCPHGLYLTRQRVSRGRDSDCIRQGQATATVIDYLRSRTGPDGIVTGETRW